MLNEFRYENWVRGRINDIIARIKILSHLLIIEEDSSPVSRKHTPVVRAKKMILKRLPRKKLIQRHPARQLRPLRIEMGGPNRPRVRGYVRVNELATDARKNNNDARMELSRRKMRGGKPSMGNNFDIAIRLGRTKTFFGRDDGNFMQADLVRGHVAELA